MRGEWVERGSTKRARFLCHEPKPAGGADTLITMGWLLFCSLFLSWSTDSLSALGRCGRPRMLNHQCRNWNFTKWCKKWNTHILGVYFFLIFSKMFHTLFKNKLKYFGKSQCFKLILSPINIIIIIFSSHKICEFLVICIIC